MLSAAAAVPLARDVRLVPAAQAPADTPAMLLEYTRAAQKWVEALPIGSGRLGAMIFGGVGTERLQLNDDTLWSGGPKDTGNPKAREVLPQVRRAVAAGRFAEADTLTKGLQGPYTQTYLPMGDLVLAFEHGDIAADYRRTLDLRTAVATTRFRVGTVHYLREVIASHPARVIAIRLTSDRPGSLRFAARLRSQLRCEVGSSGDMLVLGGRAPAHVDPSYFAQDDPVRYATDEGMRFEIRAAVIAEGGRTRATNESLVVQNADSVTLLVSSATSFNGFDRSAARDGRDPGRARIRRSARGAGPALGRSARRARRRSPRPVRSCVAVARARQRLRSGRRRAGAADRSTDHEARRLRSAARRDAVPVRPLPADCEQPPGLAAGEPPGHLERRAAGAVELELHDQHQHAR